MRYLTLLLISITIFSCWGETPEEKFKRLCPYERVLNHHRLKVPYEITPHKLNYKVGDTITVRSHFSKDVYCYGTRRTFYLDSMLIRPVISILRFYGEDQWERTNNENYVLIDSIYQHHYGNSTFGLFNHDGTQYTFDFKILVKKPGRYVMIIGDQGSNSEEQNIELSNSVSSNEELCPNIAFELANVIEGDNHLQELEPEFLYVDKEITADVYRLANTTNSVYGSGGYPWEWNGAFGFIVD